MKPSRNFWFWLFMALAVLVSLMALRGKVALAQSPGGELRAVSGGRSGPSVAAGMG